MCVHTVHTKPRGPPFRALTLLSLPHNRRVHLPHRPTMATSSSPTTQTKPASIPPSVFTLPHTAQLEALYTIIRDKNTSRGDFLFYSDRIIRLLVEEGLNHLPVFFKTVETPTVSLLCFERGTRVQFMLSAHFELAGDMNGTELVTPRVRLTSPFC